MKLSKLSALLLPLLLLTGCEGPNSVTGTLKLSSPLTINSSWNGSTRLAPGSYSARAELQSGGGKFSIGTKNGTVEFWLSQFSTDAQGNFNLGPAQTGQAFGLKGQIRDQQVSFSRTNRETCVSGTRQDCSFDINDGYTCTIENEYGSQMVRETGTETLRKAQAQILLGRAAAGAFVGTTTFGQKFKTYEPISDCR